MKFLVDAQLPPVLAAWLRGQGYKAAAVRELGLRDASDETIWAYASGQGFVIITKDVDFADRGYRGGAGPQVVWLRIGNSTNAELLAWIEPRWTGACQMLGQSHRVVLVV